MSKENIAEKLQKENAQLRAENTALKNVVRGMNSFLFMDDFDVEMLQAETLPEEDDEHIRAIDDQVRGLFNE